MSTSQIRLLAKDSKADPLRHPLGCPLTKTPTEKSTKTPPLRRTLRHPLTGKIKTYTGTSPPLFSKKAMPWGKKWPVQMSLPFFAVKAYVPGGGSRIRPKKIRKMPSGRCRYKNLLFQTEAPLKLTPARRRSPTPESPPSGRHHFPKDPVILKMLRSWQFTAVAAKHYDGSKTLQQGL